MARRKKKQPGYDRAGHVRRLARAVLGQPPAERVVPSKKKNPLKHKKRDLEREWEG